MNDSKIRWRFNRLTQTIVSAAHAVVFMLAVSCGGTDDDTCAGPFVHATIGPKSTGTAIDGGFDSATRPDASHTDSASFPSDASSPDSDESGPVEDAVAPDATPESQPDIAIAKWYDNHAAAISLNVDGNPDGEPGVVELIRENHVALDAELVTSRLNDEFIATMKSVLLPSGISFFGHGYVHENHDKMSYEQALDSATKCFNTMQELGLSPVAFAYPGGHGQKAETQRAIANAGFLSARDHTIRKDPYIVPDDTPMPRNWYLLPDIVMESYDYRQAGSRVNNTEELIPFLDGALDRTAWIIVTYHAIGLPGHFGFYYLSDFASDIEEITARDFWSASMNAVTLYVRERANAKASIRRRFKDDGTIKQIIIYLEDGLPNDRYVQPLTLLFEIPTKWVGQPLAVEDDARRWPDQVATANYAALSFPPFEREFRVSLAATPYVEEEHGSDAGM
jgi:hypothetical protein